MQLQSFVTKVNNFSISLITIVCIALASISGWEGWRSTVNPNMMWQNFKSVGNRSPRTNILLHNLPHKHHQPLTVTTALKRVRGNFSGQIWTFPDSGYKANESQTSHGLTWVEFHLLLRWELRFITWIWCKITRTKSIWKYLKIWQPYSQMSQYLPWPP